MKPFIHPVCEKLSLSSSVKASAIRCNEFLILLPSAV